MQNHQDSNNNSTNPDKAPRRSTNRKSLIYGICAVASLAFVAIIIWSVVSIFNGSPLGDDFFVSDDTKTTINISPAGQDTASDHQTRTVYEYDDDENVISMKTYFEYSSPDAAKTAYTSLKDQPEFKNSTLQSKYIIVTSDESQFKGLTASDIRQQAEAIEAYNRAQAAQNEASEDSSEE